MEGKMGYEHVRLLLSGWGSTDLFCCSNFTEINLFKVEVDVQLIKKAKN